MSVLKVPVTVPATGDGPIADVSSLTGQKTVLLSGLFRGSYDLLGSHDDVHFVAVTSFEASGAGEIKQTVAGSFKSVRIRSSAVALAPMSCEVSGVAGTNHFGVVASLPVGAGGETVAVDLYALIPPTGPESDACFICTGGFRGQVVVLGSQDGVAYRPVGSYRVDRLPEGSSEALTFPVLSTADKVRYVKLQLTGSVTSLLTVTVGGSVPLSNPAAEHPLAVVVDGVSGTAYQFEGWQSAANPVTDDLGNSVDRSSGKDVVCVGQRNTVGAQVESAPGTVNPIIVYGTANTVAASSPSATLGHTTVVGDTCTVAADAFACFVGGWRNQAGARASAAVAIGAFCTPGADTSNTVSVGAFVNFQTPTSYSVGVGNFITASPDAATPACSQLALVGYGITAQNANPGGLTYNVVAVGTGLTATAGAGDLTSVVLVGDNLQAVDAYAQGGAVSGVAVGANANVYQSVAVGNNDGSNSDYPPYGVYVGWAQSIGAGGSYNTVVGHWPSLGAACTNVTVVDASVAEDCARCIAMRGAAIGHDSSDCTSVEGATVGILSTFCIAVGPGSWVPDVSTSCTVVGHLAVVTAVAPVALTSVTVYGDHNEVTGPFSSQTLVAGNGNELTSTTNATVLGQNNVLDTTNNSGFVVIGNNHDVQVTSPSTVVGQFITLTSGWSVALGYGFTASASVIVGNPMGGGNSVYPTASVYVGLSLNVGAGGVGSNVAVGNAIVTGAASEMCTLVGHAAGASAAVSTSVALGYMARAATSHTGEVGGTSTALLDYGVNVFTVRGSQGVSPAITNIVTFQASTTPAAGEVGLTVTYNDGVAVANRTVKAAVVPPVGSVLLYVDP